MELKKAARQRQRSCEKGALWGRVGLWQGRIWLVKGLRVLGLGAVMSTVRSVAAGAWSGAVQEASCKG